MTRLNLFDVRGEDVTDEVTEELIRKGDPWRSLVRYRDGRSDLFISTRINFALLKAASALPVVQLKPESRQDELMKQDGLLTPAGSRRNYRFLERIVEAVEAGAVPACYLAEQHGDCRRDFYFVTEDADSFERLVQVVAQRCDFPLTIACHSLAEVAGTLLPREAIGDLGLTVPALARVQPTRFEFWGAAPSLARLRSGLEQRGFRFLSLETYLSELRMIKDVPIDGDFQAVLKEIVPLSRSLGCSYRGTETIDGFEQFALTRALPERYAANPPGMIGALRGIFGRRA